MILRASNISRLSVLLCCVALVSAGCGGMKSVPEGQHLLDKNIIKTDRPEFRENINAIIKQKPNKKILGIFRFHLGVYNLAGIGKESSKRDSSKFIRWMRNTIGEEPVLVDTFLTHKTSQQLAIFMQNNGYFNAVVTDTITYRKKTAKVYYTIHSGIPFLDNSIHYAIADSVIKQEVFKDTAQTHIHIGDVYSTGILQKERDRITYSLKNRGYFFFNPQYITYRVIEKPKTNFLDIYSSISNPKISARDSFSLKDSLYTHRQCVIKNIYIEMDYDPISTTTEVLKDTIAFQNYFFIAKNNRQLLYKPSRLLEQIFLKPNSLYNQTNYDLTYNHLADLSVFRFINISFKAQPELDSDGKINLDCYILLAPSARQEYTIETEGTNSGGNLGVAGNLVYRNKNIFRGAESFDFKIKGGLEIQRNFSDTTYTHSKNIAFFNAYEIGPEVTFHFPRFLWPLSTLSDAHKISNPSTSVTLGYNIQNRPEYNRQLANASFYYAWKKSKYVREFFYPFELNYLNVNLDPAFAKKLNELNDINIILGYRSQLISNGRVAYIYNNQDLSKVRNYSFFRFNFEYAGNTLFLRDKINNKPITSENPNKVFGVQYAQYLRPDIDYRFYKVFDRTRILVFRYAMGIGYAYGNSSQLPFEKSFFAGGPNDIRAWHSRSIGPGSFNNGDPFEQFGDFKINTNLEYRFDITKKLFKAAAFIDAGNVWLTREIPERPGGTFDLNKFAGEMAIGAGLGLRFDFTFFVLRLDAAVKVKDPSLPEGHRWDYPSYGGNCFQIKDITWNLGIGYPF